MPIELWTRLIADAPILGVLLIVLWRGGEKLDKLGEKLDKLTGTVKNLGAKVEMVGKIQDVRLDLHEERVETGGHTTVSNGAAAAVRHANGSAPGSAKRHPHPSWPADKLAGEDDE